MCGVLGGSGWVRDGPAVGVGGAGRGLTCGQHTLYARQIYRLFLEVPNKCGFFCVFFIYDGVCGSAHGRATTWGGCLVVVDVG